MKRSVLLSIILLQSVGCATGEFSHIEETYQEHVRQCADSNSELRTKVFLDEQTCLVEAQKVRDQSNRNKNSLRRFFGDDGPGGGNTGFVYILN